MTRLEALEQIERAARLFYIEATGPGWNAGKYTDYRMQLGSALSALPPAEPVGEVVERKIVQISTCFDRGDGYGGGGSSYMPAVEGAEPIGCPLPGACGAVRAPSAEEARLRAEVASLRATLGQQPAVEGAEPIGCPLPGACGAVRAHAAAYRAGAEAMREAAAVVAQTVRVPHMNIAPDKYAIGVEIAAAIRALPLPAGGSGWRPIETAPIDQEIDIWVARSEDGHDYSEGGYRQERVVWNSVDEYWEGDCVAVLPQQVSHWRPLPIPPAAQEPQG